MDFAASSCDPVGGRVKGVGSLHVLPFFMLFPSRLLESQPFSGVQCSGIPPTGASSLTPPMAIPIFGRFGRTVRRGCRWGRRVGLNGARIEDVDREKPPWAGARTAG